MNHSNNLSDSKIANLSNRIEIILKDICEQYQIEFTQQLMDWVNDILNLGILRNKIMFDELKDSLHKYGTSILENHNFTMDQDSK